MVDDGWAATIIDGMKISAGTYQPAALVVATLLIACLGPGSDAPSIPYREPRGKPADYQGMPTEAQSRHLYSAAFPRLLPPERKLLRRINADVNRDLRYLSDIQNYGLPDLPVTEPAVRRPLLGRLPPARYGDCEDFALTKKHRLDRAGFSATRTFVATASVPDKHGRTMHSVLAVPEGREWWILNNWHNQIERASALEHWWDWQFLRPRFDIYTSVARVRLVAESNTPTAAPAPSRSGPPANAGRR
jgi:predicted transglutaminase-like cysteine proteinase